MGSKRKHWYMAKAIGKSPQGRKNWRLFKIRKEGKEPDSSDALGDYDSLAKLESQLGYSRPGKRKKKVESRRISEDRVIYVVT